MVLERATGRVTNLTENSGPLGEQLHLVARFRQPVLHHRRPRPPEHPVDSR